MLQDFCYEVANSRSYNFHHVVPWHFGVCAIGVAVVNKLVPLHVKLSSSQQCGGTTYLVSGLGHLRLV